jgi:uncharacterized protein YjbI with pentapeptide repeats
MGTRGRASAYIPIEFSPPDNDPYGFTRMVKKNFAGARALSDTVMPQVIHDCDFSNSGLERVTFPNGAKITKSNFYGADLSEVNSSCLEFDDVNLESTVFCKAVLGAVIFKSVNARWADFSNVDFAGSTWIRQASAEDSVFDKADFAGAKLNVHFKHCSLSDAKFNGVKYEGVRFEDCKLDGVEFNSIRMRSGKFINCTLFGAKFSNGEGSENLGMCDFTGSQIGGVVFLEMNLNYTDFKYATSANSSNIGAEFRKCSMFYVVFKDTDLEDSKFIDVFASNANFKGANLNRVEFKDTVLDGADFRRAKNVRKVVFEDCAMKFAKFDKQGLTKANFIDCNLFGVSFRDCNMKGADMSGSWVDSDTDFAGAELQGVDFSKMNFKGVPKGLTATQQKEVKKMIKEDG